MKKYILIIIISFLSACTTEGMLNVFKGTGLVVTNQSTDWELIPNSFGSVSPLEFRNKTYPFIIVRIYIGGTLYNHILTKYNCESKLRNAYKTYAISMDILSSDKNNKENVYFNPSRFYFLKNTRKVEIPISRYVPKHIKKKLPNEYYDISESMNKHGYTCMEYDSPLVCGELENVEMIFDGFVVNDTPLPPIKVHLKYKDPQSIPLYSSEKK